MLDVKSQRGDGDPRERRGTDRAQDPAFPGRPGRRSRPPRGTAGRAFERLDGLVDDVDVDLLPLVGVANDEAVVTQDVDSARDPARVRGDSELRPIAEEFGIGCARHTEPGLDVVANLPVRQRRKVTSQFNPLLELPKLREVELRPQLWLAHQQNLQELLRRRLEVGEHADLLECAHVEVLRFVEHEHGALAGLPTVEHEAPQGQESVGR